MVSKHDARTTCASFGIEPALAITTAATLSSHGGSPHRAMDVGSLESTMALSDAGITLGLLPVDKHIGKRSVTDFGRGMGRATERNFAARTPIFTPTSHTTTHPSHNFLTVRTTSLQAYNCLRESFGPKD